MTEPEPIHVYSKENCLIHDLQDATTKLLSENSLIDKVYYASLWESVIELLSQNESENVSFQKLIDEITAIFYCQRLNWTHIHINGKYLCEFLDSIVALHPWVMPIIAKVLIIVLFHFQFPGGQCLLGKREELNKMLALQIFVQCFQDVLRKGKSIDRDNLIIAEAQLLEELEASTKCTQSLVGFRMFLNYFLFESIIGTFGTSTILTLALMKTLSFSQNIDLERVKYDRRIYLIPVFDSEGRFFLSSTSHYVKKTSKNLGAGFWNDYVLSLYFEVKDNLPQPASVSESINVIHGQFIAWNELIISPEVNFSLPA
jgi:hypothetical protein